MPQEKESARNECGGTSGVSTYESGAWWASGGKK